ncbi:MAG: hypothetical protein DME25_16995, partial [Verrucomicrobia bacterium]
MKASSNQRNRLFRVALALLFAPLAPSPAATITWTNVLSGGWNTAANWSPNTVPGAGDTAVITNTGNYTVTLDISPTVTGLILGASSGVTTQTLAMNGQTFTLNGPCTINSRGLFSLGSGALSGGTTSSISGIITWTGGTLAGTLTFNTNATLSISGGGNHDIPSCVLTNNGAVTWSGGPIRGGGNPGTFIYNNGVWDSQGDLTWNNDFFGSGTVFNNAGTFRKSASQVASGSTIFVNGVVLNNTGKLDAQTNYLNLQGGGTLTGGTATNLNGFVYLNGGAFNVNGTVTSTNAQLAGATLTGNNVITGGFNWIVGDWNSAASVTISANTLLLVTSANDHNLANTVVTNNGTIAWSNGRIRGGGNPGTFIYNNGVWDSQGDLTWNNDFFGSGTVFNNLGTLRKSGGASEFTNATVFTSGVFLNQLAGVIDVQNGTNGLELAFQGGGNFTGGYITTNAFGLTVLSSGNFTLNGTVSGTNTWENS